MRAFALSLVAAFVATGAVAKEIPLGAPKTEGGMNIAAVYLQPIEMEPEGMMRPAKESDVHMEADIKAAKGNTNGFAEGDWIPYLVVNYELTREGGPTQKGEFMPMVANDGPHYGDNVKLSVELQKPIAMDDGVRFAIREGGRTVGSGVVTKILS